MKFILILLFALFSYIVSEACPVVSVAITTKNKKKKILGIFGSECEKSIGEACDIDGDKCKCYRTADVNMCKRIGCSFSVSKGCYL